MSTSTTREVTGRPGRYQRSAAGMVGALIVLIGLVIAFVVLRDVNRNELRPPTPDVDYVQDAQFAREQASFELLAPQRLPEGWQATSVRYVPGKGDHWHLGMLTGDGQYVGLEQSGGSARSMVESHVDEAARRGARVRVDGVPWATWTDEGGDVALVREDPTTTTLVVGNDVPVDELRAFAASLR